MKTYIKHHFAAIITLLVLAATQASQRRQKQFCGRNTRLMVRSSQKLRQLISASKALRRRLIFQHVKTQMRTSCL